MADEAEITSSAAAADPAPAPAAEPVDANLAALEAEEGTLEISTEAAPAATTETETDPATETEAAPASQAATTPTPAKHPLAMRVAARERGASDAEIDAASPDQLANFVLSRPAPQARQQPVAPVDDDPLAGHDWGVDKVTGEKLTAENFDPAIVSLQRKLAIELRDTRRQLAQQAQHHQRQQQQAAIDQIDDAFAKVAKKHPDKFSAARLGSIPEAELPLRDIIIRAAQGNPAAIEKIAEQIYGKGQSAADQALTTRKKQFENGRVSRPTSRQGAAAPRGDAAARQAVRQFFDSLGSGDVNGEFTPEDMAK